ncbi:hypothetical protein WIS52_26395 [Pseudonocardia nematodicida]|uniref:Uncharacterized protein n=1 Tax=Pseudonocardia nematodicida TaxID=1206997 RepID=A0ABV1KHV1_9PSEU
MGRRVAAYDLQRRIYDIIERGFRGTRNSDYFATSTRYVVAEFLGWLEIIRRFAANRDKLPREIPPRDVA